VTTMTAMPPGAPACPSDLTFTRLIEGLLPAPELAALEAHCDGCTACGRTLAELARTIAPDAGEWLGERYRVLGPLGAGGMGVVYTAFDSKLRRKVAVKRLREAAPDAAGPAGGTRRARFLREAQLLASLSHPNVLTVHDVVPHEERLPRWLEQRVLRRVYRSADVYVVLHETVGDRPLPPLHCPARPFIWRSP